MTHRLTSVGRDLTRGPGRLCAATLGWALILRRESLPRSPPCSLPRSPGCAKRAGPLPITNRKTRTNKAALNAAAEWPSCLRYSSEASLYMLSPLTGRHSSPPAGASFRLCLPHLRLHTLQLTHVVVEVHEPQVERRDND